MSGQGQQVKQTEDRSMAHTPGPWSADKWATGWTVSAPDSHYSVCHLEDCNNAEANVRLIASAPALLTAIKEAIGWMRHGVPSENKSRAQVILEKALADAV